jgi:hypothetical protein
MTDYFEEMMNLDVEEPETQAHGYFKPDTEKDVECKHHYWIKRCSMCKAILESDTQHNCCSGESLKISYSELDSLVCTLRTAKELKDLGVIQKSKLYWVEQPEQKIVSVRCHENAHRMKGMVITAAFTSSELNRQLVRLPKCYHTSQMFQYMGRQGHDPNRLARLLIKILKNKHD